MTPQDVITEVRRLIQDTSASIQRYSDSMLLGFVNQTIKRMVPMRPDMFISTETIATTADTVVQELPSDAVRLVEVFQVTGGDAVREVNRETLDQMYPGWRTETSGTPLNWMRNPRNPTGFMVYPRPTSGVTLVVEYVKTPEDYALGDAIDVIPEAYFTALIDGTTFLAESIDAEHVGNGRAKFYYDSFLEALGADFSQRSVVDGEGADVGRNAQRRRTEQQPNAQ